MGSLLGLVALAAAVAAGLRWAGRRARERGQPGRDPARPIAIHDYGEMDLAIAQQRCSCGGRYAVRGEGPGNPAQVRVAHLECRRCDREAWVYFDVGGVRH